MKSFLNQSNLVRGLRNNNPGNLIQTNINWQGKIPFAENPDKRFEQFKELRYGIRAFYHDMINDIGKGANTIVKLVSEYAPAFENNTTAYINSVAKAMGVGKNDILKADKATLMALAKAKFAVELGLQNSKLITDSDYQEAMDIVGVELKQGSTICKYCGHALVIIGLFFFTYLTVTV